MDTNEILTQPEAVQPLQVACLVCGVARPCVETVLSCGVEVDACHVCRSLPDCDACEQEASC